MAEKTAKKAKVPTPRTAAGAKKTTAGAKKTTAGAKKSAAPEQKSAVDRTMDLSEEVLASVEAGQRAAIEAIRKFVEAVDDALPAIGDRPSRREKVIDAAMELSDRLVTTQYEFLRSVVHDAGRALSRPNADKS